MVRLAGVAGLLGMLVVGSTAFALSGPGRAARPSRRDRRHRAHVHGHRRSSRGSGAGTHRHDGRPAARARTDRTRAAQRPAARALPVAMRIGRRGRVVPPGFFGLSFEYWGLADDERRPLLFDRVLGLLHAAGTGPMTIRIGGDSAQQTFSAIHRGRFARWQFGVGRRWIRRTAHLLDHERLRAILDLNQVSGDPAQAAALAARLVHGLPRDRIAGFELGNEPDIYARALWAAEIRRTPRLAATLPLQITPDDYDADYLADADALTRVAPRIPLMGPVLAEPRIHRRWIESLLRAPHPRLAAITVHQYPYSACSPPTAANYPTIARLLSRHAIGAMAADVAPAVAIARRAHLPLRVTEFNSVTCGGRRGVSSSFATALWAPGALFEMLSAGARSADLHARATAHNSPFRWDRRGLSAQPLLYGLLLFVRALGPGARLLPTHLRDGHLARVDAWAVRLRSGAEHVVVVDRGTRRLALRLRAPAGRRVSEQRLLAPDVRSGHRVTLAGQTLSPGARWRGRRVEQRIADDRGRVDVRIAAHSAALITIDRHRTPIRRTPARHAHHSGRRSRRAGATT